MHIKKAILAILSVLLLVTGCSKDPSVAVPNKKTAVAIAQAYFDEMEKDEYTENFVLDEVTYNTEKEAWVVVFWNDFSKPGPYSTGALYITIRESDAEIISVFCGELMPDGSPA